jgi:competence protein ComEA
MTTEMNLEGRQKMTTPHQKIAACIAFTLLALAAAPSVAASGKVNINEATVEQLVLLPRVGAVVAERIVAFRSENGRFSESRDLMLVRGIGERTFQLLEPWIALEGETTLTEKVKSSAAEASDGSAGDRR